MQASEGNDLLNRMLTAPMSIDCADISITFLKYLVGRDVLQAVPVAKVKDWDKTIPVLTKGELPDGRKAPRQGTAPWTVIYANDAGGQTFHDGPSEWLTVLPMITNGDTLGIRPDLTGRPVTSWADLLSADFKGRAALQEQPTIGVMDTALALEALGEIKYGDKGNMTKEEIDKTVKVMTDFKKNGQFRSFWSTFDQSVNLMASGEVVIQSMIAPAVAAVRSRGIACTFQPLKEGYRGWCTAFGVMKHVQGLELDCFYEYLNWYTSGFQGAPSRAKATTPRQPGERPQIPDAGGMGLSGYWRQACHHRHRQSVRQSDGTIPVPFETAVPSGIDWAISPRGTR